MKPMLVLLSLILWSNAAFAQETEAQTFTPWKNYLNKKAQVVELNDGVNDDLKAFKKALLNKRIVLLGEFNHGTKEINLLKNRLIQYLHQELGYKVLLLESGVGEVATLNQDRKGMAKENMVFRLTGPWQSKEFVALMGFLQENENLTLGGFDPQKSGSAFTSFFKQKMEKIDPVLAAFLSQTELKNQNFTREIQRVELTHNHFATRDSIIQDYQHILKSLGTKKEAFLSEKQSGIDFKIMLKTLENRIAYLHYFTTYKQQFHQRWAARDSLMAANVLWYANELYPDEKIIISAHNYHISKYNETELVMGEILKAKFSDELYAIGFFGGKGTFANNARKTESLSAATGDKDIKALISTLQAEAVFFDFPDKITKRTSWLAEEITVNDTFIDLDNHNNMQISKWFDGLFLVKHITPAEY